MGSGRVKGGIGGNGKKRKEGGGEKRRIYGREGERTRSLDLGYPLFRFGFRFRFWGFRCVPFSSQGQRENLEKKGRKRKGKG